MAEDLRDEDVVGHVLGFEAVAADSGVGASQVAWFPRFVQGAEGSRNVFGELRAGGGVDGVGALEGFEIPESVEGLDDLFWIGQERDRVRLEAGAGGLPCFELAIEDEGGEGEFLGRQAEIGAKEDLSRPTPGERHQAHAFFEAAVAGQEVESFFYEGLRVVVWVSSVGLAVVVCGTSLAGAVSGLGAAASVAGGFGASNSG
jgi:hypothetical protein